MKQLGTRIATTAAIANYATNVADKTVQCLTETGEDNKVMQSLQRQFKAQVLPEHWWIYWDL
jgi:hypothetical protein